MNTGDTAELDLEELWLQPVAHRHGRPRRAATALVRVVLAVIGTATIAAVAGLLLIPVGSGPATPPSHLYTWKHGPPTGITLSGLQAYVMGPRVVVTLKHQIAAAHNYWHARTIRLQITQDRLIGDRGHQWNAAYFRNVRLVTDYGLSLGLTMVLNAQTEMQTGYARNEPLPTRATYAFWSQMMRRWKNNPRVVFDLFNEPRRCSWGQWQDTHQGLINYIRAAGARNWIWVEGRWWGSTLDGVPLLHDPLHRLAYTFHHPGAPWDWQIPPTKATWDKAFGDLAEQGVPVIDGEFANYIGSYHWAHSGPTVRRYLAYLTAHHVGMLAWSLLPGALNSSLDYASVSHEPQGDGALVRAWFARQRRT